MGPQKAFEDLRRTLGSDQKTRLRTRAGDLPKDVTKFLKLGGNRGGSTGSVVTGKRRQESDESEIHFEGEMSRKNKETATPWYAEIKIRVQADDAAPTIDIESADCGRPLH